MTQQKLILTDADGVLFDWVSGFTTWMGEQGWHRLPYTQGEYTIDKWYNIPREQAMDFVAAYNCSSAMEFLPPYLDSVKYVKKLHDEHGYKFTVITAMGSDPVAMKLRDKNLLTVFGDIFIDILYVDLLQSKKRHLELYEPTIWIEDKPSAAEEGMRLGHRSYLFEHGHNGHVNTSPEITRVMKWAEIYASVVAEDEMVEIPALQT